MVVSLNTLSEQSGRSWNKYTCDEMRLLYSCRWNPVRFLHQSIHQSVVRAPIIIDPPVNAPSWLMFFSLCHTSIRFRSKSKSHGPTDLESFQYILECGSCWPLPDHRWWFMPFGLGSPYLPIHAGCPVPIIPLKRSPLFFDCSFLSRWSEMIPNGAILQLLLGNNLEQHIRKRKRQGIGSKDVQVQLFLATFCTG